MPVEKKMELGVLNVVIHPHKTQDYVALIKKASKVGAVKVRGTTFCELKHVENDGEKLVYAEIYKYTDIDRSSQWYNKTTSKMATDEELESVSIPEDLSPNAGKFSIYLYPEKHLIFYQSYTKNQSISPSTAVTIFENLFARESVKKTFGPVVVTHVPDKSAVDDIIVNSNKESLFVQFSRPNPDSLESIERNLMEKMNKRNVAEHSQEYKAIDGKFIEMDEDMKIETRIASKNGVVRTRIVQDNGAKKIISTTDFPFTNTSYYVEATINETQKFKAVVESLIDKVSSWLN